MIVWNKLNQEFLLYQLHTEFVTKFYGKSMEEFFKNMHPKCTLFDYVNLN